MRFWWLDKTNRLGEEMRSITALGSNESWFALTLWRFFEGRLCAERSSRRMDMSTQYV